MNGQASWQSEWMKVSTTTCPRYCERLTRRPFWSTKLKLRAWRLGGISGPAKGELDTGAVAPVLEPLLVARTTNTIAASRAIRTPMSAR